MNIKYMNGKRSMVGISIWLIILSVLSFGQYYDYDDNIYYQYYSYTLGETSSDSVDTTPPDTFSTPPQFARITEDTITITVNPSQISSIDWASLTITMHFDEDSSLSVNGIATSTGNISFLYTKAQLLTDSVLYYYFNSLSFGTYPDSTEAAFIIPTLRDSSSNTIDMDAVSTPLTIIDLVAYPSDSTWVSTDFDSVFVRTNPTGVVDPNNANYDHDVWFGTANSHTPSVSLGGNIIQSQSELILGADSTFGRAIDNGFSMSVGDTVWRTSYYRYVEGENSYTGQTHLLVPYFIWVDLYSPVISTFSTQGYMVSPDSVEIDITMLTVVGDSVQVQDTSGTVVLDWVLSDTFIVNQPYAVGEDSTVHFWAIAKDSLDNRDTSSIDSTVVYDTGDETPPVTGGTFAITMLDNYEITADLSSATNSESGYFNLYGKVGAEDTYTSLDTFNTASSKTVTFSGILSLTITDSMLFEVRAVDEALNEDVAGVYDSLNLISYDSMVVDLDSTRFHLDALKIFMDSDSTGLASADSAIIITIGKLDTTQGADTCKAYFPTENIATAKWWNTRTQYGNWSNTIGYDWKWYKYPTLPSTFTATALDSTGTPDSTALVTNGFSDEATLRPDSIVIRANQGATNSYPTSITDGNLLIATGDSSAVADDTLLVLTISQPDTVYYSTFTGRHGIFNTSSKDDTAYHKVSGADETPPDSATTFTLAGDALGKDTLTVNAEDFPADAVGGKILLKLGTVSSDSTDYDSLYVFVIADTGDWQPREFIWDFVQDAAMYGRMMLYDASDNWTTFANSNHTACTVDSTGAGGSMNGTLFEDWYSDGGGDGEDDNDQMQTWVSGAVHDVTNWDDSNTTTPIGGTEDLSLHATDDDDANRYVVISGTGTICVAYEMEFNEEGTSEQCGIIIDHATPGNPLSALYHIRWMWDVGNSDHNAKVYYDSGTSNADASPDTEMPGDGTVMWFAVSYVAGSGANGQVDLYSSTSKPTESGHWTQNLDVNDGTDTVDAGVIGIYGDGITLQIGEIIYTTDGTLPYWAP